MKDAPTKQELKDEVSRLKECLIEDFDLHLYEQDQRNLASLQKYLIVNDILTIDDLAVLAGARGPAGTDAHSDKVSKIAYNCMTLAYNSESDIFNNMLEGDEPNSKIYYETPCSPGYKELREDSIKVQMERGRTREEAEVAYDEWINTEVPNTASTVNNLRELIIKKKEASKC